MIFFAALRAMILNLASTKVITLAAPYNGLSVGQI